jgi:hypothetical protein
LLFIISLCMIGHNSAGPLWTCVKVDDCCDPSAVDTLTLIKSLEHIYECVSVTNCM